MIDPNTPHGRTEIADLIDQAIAIWSAVNTIKQTGGSVQIAGVRIEPCDGHGRTATTRIVDELTEQIKFLETMNDMTDMHAEKWQQRAREAETKLAQAQSAITRVRNLANDMDTWRSAGALAQHYANAVRDALNAPREG